MASLARGGQNRRHGACRIAKVDQRASQAQLGPKARDDDEQV